MRNFAPQQIITYRIQLYVIEVKLAKALPLYAPPTSILRELPPQSAFLEFYSQLSFGSVNHRDEIENEAIFSVCVCSRKNN